MVTLGVCAAAFVVSSSSASVQGEDDIRNVYGPHIIGLAEKNLHTQKALARKSKLALIDPSEEKDLDRAIQTAFKTFAKATNETVIAQATAWDPAKMEEKVADNMAEIQDIITETGEEAKMLAKFQQPDDPKQVAVDDPGAAR
jgi:hypothetical protein